MRHILRILFVVHALACCAIAQTVGQWELRKRTSTGFTSYGLTAVNGQAIGFSGGVPAMLPITASPAWGDITGKPSTFPPEAHNQAISTITGLQTALDAKANTSALSAYLTSATAASTYAPINHTQAINTITGLQTALDAKAPLASPTFTGTVNIGSLTASGGPFLLGTVDSGTVASLAVKTFGQGFYCELQGFGSQAFHAHVSASSSGVHTAYDCDLTGGTGGNFGLGALTKPGDFVIYHRDNNGGDPQDRFTLAHSGTMTWYANGTSISAGTNKTSLAVETPSGTSAYTLKAGRTGDIVSTGDTGTVTNAMLAGSIALSKLATTGTADSSTYLRGDGAWASITTGATLGANIFNALQSFTGTTHAGLRLNNLTTTERNALTPQAGMLIWNTTNQRLDVYDGAAWSGGFVRLSGDNMSGLLSFTGTTHAGIRLINLTTTQRDALTGLSGMVIWNTTAGRLQLHNGSAWTAGMVRLDGDTMTGTLTITPAANTSALAVTGYSLTGSSTTALATMSGTWNTTGIAEGLLLNITNTASNASSRLLRLQVGSVDRFAVAPTGGVTLRHSSSANDAITMGGTSNMIITAQSNSGGLHYQIVADSTGAGGPASFRFGAGALLEWNSVSNLAVGSRDLKIGRDSAAILQLGEDHATTATNHSLKAHDVTTGTGASLDLRGGNGSSSGGSVTISTSATTTPAVRMTIKPSGVINLPSLPTSSAGLSSGDLWNDAGTVKIVP